jgi:hypothetical protein
MCGAVDIGEGCIQFINTPPFGIEFGIGFGMGFGIGYGMTPPVGMTPPSRDPIWS